MFKYKLFLIKDDGREVPVYGIGNGAADFVSAMRLLDEAYEGEIDRVEWLSLVCHKNDVLEFNEEKDFEEFEDKFEPYIW